MAEVATKKREIQIIKEETNKFLPPEILQESVSKISSIYHNRAPLKPKMDPTLEKRLIGDIVGVSPEDPEIGKVMRKFWAEMSIKVEQGGRVLNITMNEDGYPENPLDYLRYEFIKAHKEVADSEMEMKRHPNKHFWVRDPEAETQRTNEEVKKRKQAYTEFVNIGDDEDKMDMVLRAMGTLNPTELSVVEKENLLEKYATKEPAKFYEVATDKNLSVRAEILDMVDNGVLNRLSSGIFFGDDALGSTMDEAIKYFKSKKNSETILILRDKLNEATK